MTIHVNIQFIKQTGVKQVEYTCSVLQNMQVLAFRHH